MRRSKALGISAAGIGIAGATLAGLALAGTGVAAAIAIRNVRKRRSHDFSGRIVLITGGSRGLGLAVAQEFGRRGAKLAICARRADELADAEAKLRSENIDCFSQVCDVSKRDQVKNFVAAVRSHYGHIDILVNNAGIIQAGPFENQQIEDFEQAMAINFWGAVYFTYEVIGDMLRAGRGNIVNICSVGGKVAVPHLLPYSASKFAITGFSEGLRSEMSGKGVEVTTVCPGLMRTGSQFQALFKGQHEKEFAWFLNSSSTPLTSINARRAAKQIVNATRRGQALLIITWQAELLARTHGFFPELVTEINGLVNRLLPSPNDAGAGDDLRAGHELESAATRHPITVSNRIAARRLNERHA